MFLKASGKPEAFFVNAVFISVNETVMIRHELLFRTGEEMG